MINNYLQFIFIGSIDILIYFYTFVLNNLKKQYENTNEFYPVAWDIHNSNTCV